jgi:hypothetical protein
MIVQKLKQKFCTHNNVIHVPTIMENILTRYPICEENRGKFFPRVCQELTQYKPQVIKTCLDCKKDDFITIEANFDSQEQALKHSKEIAEQMNTK